MNRCPVCQARFRGARLCSRCGADLEPLMLLAVKSWRLRQAARQALAAGDFEQALELASQAQQAQHTGSGESLRMLSRWLATHRLPSDAPRRSGWAVPKLSWRWVCLLGTISAVTIWRVFREIAGYRSSAHTISR